MERIDESYYIDKSDYSNCEEIDESKYEESLEILEKISKIQKIVSDIESKKNEILNLCSDFCKKNEIENIEYNFLDFSNGMHDIIEDMTFKHDCVVSEYESYADLKWDQSLRSDYYKSVL